LRIRKTVVGSIPRWPMNMEEAIKTAIDVQLRAGIEIVSDGEQRSDMITYFEQIPGLVHTSRGMTVNSKISPPEDPSVLTKVRDFMSAKKYLNDLGRGDIPVKTAITGPITLGVTCAASGLKYYSGFNDENLYRDLSRALESVATKLLQLGSYVQWDEPGLSAGYMAPSKALPILNELLDNIQTSRKIPGSVSVHVCGNLARISGLLDGLLGLNLDVISLAFSGSTEEQNLNLVSEDLFEKSGKRLGLGCTKASAAKMSDVEDVELVYQRIRSIADRVGSKNVAYAHPDCGLKGTTLDVSELILQRLSDAVDRYNRNLPS